MGSSADRFYQMQLRNRPAYLGDVGSMIRIDGIIVSGGKEHMIMLLPSATKDAAMLVHDAILFELKTVQPTPDEWSDFLQRSDVPEILIDPLTKAFHRKVRYEISGIVQQKVWVADGFVCRYCGRPMGKVQLTIDHFIPLELGGENNIGNYLSACRKCNKDKGNTHPKEWCPSKFDVLERYLKDRIIQ